MKFFLDTEFIEDGRTIDLISIGVVSEGGAEFYRQDASCDLRKANEFVRNNVIPHLQDCPQKMPQRAHATAPCGVLTCPWAPRRYITRELQNWVNNLCIPGSKPEFWGYYADYDWVAVAQLFGRMVDLPPTWPMYCRDIKQSCDDMGNPTLPKQTAGEHNALADARWNREAWNFLYERSTAECREKVAPRASSLTGGR